MTHAFKEILGRGVLSHSQDLPPADPRQAPGAGDEQEAERSHAPQGIGVGPFPRAGLRRGRRVELETTQEVVGEDAELLPGAVGAAVRDEILLHELNAQIIFDVPSQTAYSQAHDRGLLCERVAWPHSL